MFLVLVLAGTGAARAQFTAEATDDVFEEGVRVSWSGSDDTSVYYRILRDGVLLSAAASSDSVYGDTNAIPAVTYMYCVEKVDIVTQVLIEQACDAGRRILFRPGSVQASDRAYEDEVRVTWIDRSTVEAGFRIYRSLAGQGSFDLVGTTEAGLEFFKDSSAVAGVGYDYCVATTDEDGHESERVCDAGERGHVRPPGNVAATDGQYTDRVVVTWVDRSGSETGYRIYRDDVLIDTTEPDSTRYVDFGGLGAPHNYCAATLTRIAGDPDSVDVESARECDAGAGGLGVMAPPGDVTATDDLYDDRVVLVWTDPSTAEDGFVIARDGIVIAELAADWTTYDDTDAEPGVTHAYCVAAKSDHGGTSEPTCDNGSRAVVVAPTNVAANDGEHEDQVRVTWDNASTTVVLFRVSRDGIPIQNVAGSQLFAIDSEVESGVSHEYCIQAMSPMEDLSPAACDSGYREIEAPTAVAAADGDYEDRVVVSWTDRSLVETGYRIYRAGDGSPMEEIGTTLPNRSSFADTSAVSGARYLYTVEAFDDFGRSASLADSGGLILNAPTELVASDGDYEKQIVLSWEDNSFAEAGYRIVRTGGDGQHTADVPPGTTEYTDGSVVFGLAYTYEVFVLGRHGGTSEAATDDGFTTILSPGSVSASTEDEDAVVVTWIDRSGIESGFEISRDGVVLGTTAANVESFTDVSGAPGVSYDYCVKALIMGVIESEAECARGLRPASVETPIPVQLLQTQLRADDADAGDDVGSSVAVDGDHAVVGAVGSSSAYFFRRDPVTGQWSQIDKFTHGTWFGFAVALDGDWAVVSDPWDSRIYVYHFDGSAWDETQDFQPVLPSARGGSSLAMEGRLLLIGCPGFGSGKGITEGAWRAGNQYGFPFDIEDVGAAAGAAQGSSVAISGDWIAIGAPNDRENNVRCGTVSIYQRTQGNLFEIRTKTGPWVDGVFEGFEGGDYGTSVALEAGRVAVGDEAQNNYKGACYVWDFQSGDPHLQKRLAAVDGVNADAFGHRIALSDELCFVGGYDIDVPRGLPVYVFKQDPSGDWLEKVRMSSPAHSMGGGLSVAGGRLVAGSTPRGDETSAVFTFDLSPPPGGLTASDGTFADRVRIRWQDRSLYEDGFNIYRDGEQIESVAPGTTSYNDDEAEPGRIHEYCVTAFSTLYGESDPVCDLGRRPPNGAVNGRVSTRAGASVKDVDVCIDPPPGNALLLDGASGHLLLESAVVPSAEFTFECWVNAYGPDREGTPLSYMTSDSAEAIVLRNVHSLDVTVAGAAWHTDVNVADHDWHHLAFTWRSADGRSRLYVDGVLAAAATLAAGAAVPSGGTLVLGQDQTAPQTFDPVRAYIGRIDEVRIWSVERDEQEIMDLMHTVLQGTEEGLSLYWPLDEGTGTAAADLTAAAQYGERRGGVHWTASGAPVVICGQSDTEGNYSISRLRYDGSTTLKLIPSLPFHTFEPAFKTLTLSRESPVQNEVGFADVTSFAVSGIVTFNGYNCPEQGVPIFVDGTIAGRTDAEGRYKVSALPGSHRIEPRLEAHTFEPDEIVLDVAQDLAGRNFTDTTTRTLSGRVGGGCDRPIGTLTLMIQSEDGCVQRSMSTDRDYNASLPPMRYFVSVDDVTDVPGALDPVEIQKYFEDLGSKAADLSAADEVIDFTYRAPIEVEIEGFPAPPDCETITDPESGVSVPAAPILPQGEAFPLTVRVFEDYGDGNRCPVDSGLVTIFDEVMDEADAPMVLAIKNGQVRYETIGNTPNIFIGRRDAQGRDRSFQKPLTVVAEVEGRAPLQRTVWAIVTGDRPRAGTFVSATSQEFPLLILRDPPGDGSSSSIQQGQSVTAGLTGIFVESLSGHINYKTKAGLQFDKGAPGFTTETKAATIQKGSIEVGMEATQQGGIQVSVNTNEKFSTSGSESFVGSGADVFLGVAMNLVFAKTDVIDVTDCAIARSQTVRFGADANEPYDTVYLYTADHIENTVIPQLEDLAELSPDSAAAFQAYIENWQSQLELNETQKEAALEVPEENRSFSAGADYEFTISSSTTGTFQESVKLFSNTELAWGLEFEETGSGGEFELGAKLGFSFTLQASISDGRTTTVSYALVDDDPGDYFSVDVGTDDAFGTPVFGLKSGRSSCPWEPGPDHESPLTQPRDGVDLAAGASPDGPGPYSPDAAVVIPLTITNMSDSEEEREYELWPVQTANAGGAVLKLNGAPFLGGESFTIVPDRAQMATLTVERGPAQYFYDGLQVMAVSPCDGQISDVASFDVHFDAACSDISLFRPQTGWAFNKADAEATGNTLEIVMDEFEFDIGDKHLESIGAEYRKQGTDQAPLPIGMVSREEIPTYPNGDPMATPLSWSVASIPDGVYEVRAYTSCNGGRAYSAFAPGRIDRVNPKPFGAPQPADLVLTLGDEISITFDEQILCASAKPQNVTLVVDNPSGPAAPVEIEISCDGRTLIMTPTSPPLSTLEGKTLVAKVEAVTDRAGNPMQGREEGSTSETWSFVVRRSQFAWAKASITKEVPFGDPGSISAQLVNGRADDVEFVLMEVPDWLTPSATSGIVPSGGAMPIAFDIQDDLPIGLYTATVSAEVQADGSLAPLEIEVDVVCAPPAWEAHAESFEQNMSAVVRVKIGDEFSADTSDVVAAFVGNSLRGVAPVQRIPELGGIGMAFLTIGSNRRAGERIRFRVWDDSECRLYRTTDQIVNYVADQQVGSPVTPLTVTAIDVPTGNAQEIEMSAGWNWFSLNLGQVDMSVDGVFADLNPRSGDVVKARNVFSQFDESAGWLGSLTEFDNSSMFAVKLSEPGTVIHQGEPRNDAIALGDKWNWISYLPQAVLPVGEALRNLTPAEGDVIKSQHAFAQAVEEGGEKYWIGSLTQMEPGRGYKLYLEDASASGGRLLYPVAARPGPDPAGSGGTAVRLAQAEPPTVSRDRAVDGTNATNAHTHASGAAMPPPFDPMEYQYNMTVTGSFSGGGEGASASSVQAGDFVAAFVGDEVRGLAVVDLVPGLDRILFFLMIHSNATAGETVTFRVYKGVGGAVLDVEESAAFIADGVLGLVESPFFLTVRGLADGEIPSRFELLGSSPNPMRAEDGALISYALPGQAHVRLTIFDVAGRQVKTLVDAVEAAGWHRAVLDPSRLPSGIYLCRMEAEGFSDSRRLLVVK